MNGYEIKSLEPDVKYDVAKVEFSNFESYKAQAQQIAEFVSSIVVTEDTVKAAKKMLAQARSIVNELNKSRIQMKKEILGNFPDFETQVKELQTIIDNADGIVRSQVKELEEKERAEKLEQIKAIWEQRAWAYDVAQISGMFDDFMEPAYLNKSCSVSKVEKAMTEYLESKEKDYQVIRGLPNSKEVFEYFIKTKDLTQALADLAIAQQRKEEASKILKKEEAQSEPVMIFKVTGAKDIKLTKMILKENGIDYSEV
jgi:hypothetical protein